MVDHINDRKITIIEYSTEKNWFDQIPLKNWLCVLIVNDKPRRYIDEVIRKVISKDVVYICTIGKQSKQIHDLIDEEISFIAVDINSPYLPQHTIITTWHLDFEEGIWFSLFAAYSEEVIIKEIVILDMTDGSEIPRVKAFIKKIDR
ncbi:hypothetical protein GCM10027275_17730 [Rhabdobacter roseus]|uniref:DUF7684 domain-containing protein n=1 Tax=Rhabdobacter roseus TaxID=1655419 RepID=A0A840THR4_9BACT|nr:hypothetical protein [Rhabdobacter roseus]MBB5283696.1 hypothetical protein [Rhabdobacter roseus]